AGNATRVKEEIGDLLLSLVNTSRFLNVSAEEALTSSLEKFRKRFRYIETKLAEKGKDPRNSSLREMDDLWNEAKLEE
ncbi:MAG TPA: MazG nucleotide pyrophosphohydrolase domain-containing protein, partial [Syntrophales bacterium]|nr:MazG nucleotide pyrophosphohydrolase domain-containing protein [Syntrophales bacterium]